MYDRNQSGPGASGRSSASGVNLIELVVVMALMALVIASTALWLHRAEGPVQTGAALLESFFKQARAKAMATTRSYRVSPLSAETVHAEYAARCSETSWTADGDSLRLTGGVELADTGWSACFDSRGLADSNLVVVLTHPELGNRQVEILLGGGTRVIP